MSTFFNMLLAQDLLNVSTEHNSRDDCDETSSVSTEMQMEEELDEENDEDYADIEGMHEESTAGHVLSYVVSQNNNNCITFIKTPCDTNYDKILQIPESLFRKYFQLSKDAALHLVRIVMGYDASRRMTADAHANALYNFLIAFHYFSTGQYDLTLEPEHMRCLDFSQLNQPIQIIKCIIVHIAQLVSTQKRYLSFPKSKLSKRRLVEGFEERHGIKHTLGCIDCLQVSIAMPSKEPQKYLNRRKYESLNVEAICDSNLRFTSVRIFPGSNSDCFSFSKSPVRDNLYEMLTMKFFDVETINWLLADLAYPVDTFILPPFEQNLQRELESTFNELHMKVFDSTIKRAFELVRTIFKCLLKHKPIDFEPKEASYIVRACFALYNILLKHGDIDLDMDVFEVDDMDECYSKFKTKSIVSCPMGEIARSNYAKTLLRKSF